MPEQQNDGRAHRFIVTVEKEGKPTIKLGDENDENITDIVVHLDTIDNNIRDKSGAMLARIIVKGDIKDPTNKKLADVFDWAKDFTKAGGYRKVTIDIKEEGTRMRTYRFEDVFVRDYTESFAESGGKNIFTLEMTQKENTLAKAITTV
ncbi:MAG: hypothetical protein IJU76_15350 [Desulfovibrionaceae bacterium]|nr:hypothetical protein [Desulfovibrionaceae bacterium]